MNKETPPGSAKLKAQLEGEWVSDAFGKPPWGDTIEDAFHGGNMNWFNQRMTSFNNSSNVSRPQGNLSAKTSRQTTLTACCLPFG